jgi:hypothetical protein
VPADPKGEAIMTTPTRIVMVVGTAFVAALIGLAPAARADEPDPFQVLFGDNGFNAWTTTADTDLASSSPTLAGSLDASATNFEYVGYDTFTRLADTLDPSAFSGINPAGLGVLPDSAIGDLAVGTDYTLYATGLGSLDFDLGVLVGLIDPYPI